MGNKHIKKYLKGALLLSVASLIAKILSALYRIPFQNLVGNTGFYVYQQVYPIYGIGSTFALTGFPIFISKMIAEQKTQEKKSQLARQIFIILLILGIIIFCVLRKESNFIANLMGDIELSPLIDSVAWMFLLMPFLSVGRGYYQGIFNVWPTAVSQVLEQFIRVGFIVFVAYYAVYMNWSVYKMGTWAMLGSTFGGIGAFLVLTCFFIKDFHVFSENSQRFNYYEIIKRLLSEGLIICLFASMMVLLQLVDSFTVTNSLLRNGMAPDIAKSIKGTYDRAQPMVQVGLVVSVSFASMLMPALTNALTSHQMNNFRVISKTLLRVSLTISLAATAGMAILMPEINTLLFGNRDLSMTIAIYIISIVLVTLISTYNSILQSLNQYLSTVIGLLLAVVVKFFANLVLIHYFNITGASLATIVALLVALAVVIYYLPSRIKGLLVSGDHFVIKLFISIMCMVVSVKLVIYILEMYIPFTRMNTLFFTGIGIIVGVVVFLVLILIQRLFSVREWLIIPGGKEIINIIKKIQGVLNKNEIR